MSQTLEFIELLKKAVDVLTDPKKSAEFDKALKEVSVIVHDKKEAKELFDKAAFLSRQAQQRMAEYEEKEKVLNSRMLDLFKQKEETEALNRQVKETLANVLAEKKNLELSQQKLNKDRQKVEKEQSDVLKAKAEVETLKGTLERQVKDYKDKLAKLAAV